MASTLVGAIPNHGVTMESLGLKHDPEAMAERLQRASSTIKFDFDYDPTTPIVETDMPRSEVGFMNTGLFNSAHGTIRGLGEAVTQVIDVLTTVNHLSDYSYPEAIQLREGILRELQKLTGVLAVVNARLDEDPEHPALEPKVSVDC